MPIRHGRPRSRFDRQTCVRMNLRRGSERSVDVVRIPPEALWKGVPGGDRCRASRNNGVRDRSSAGQDRSRIVAVSPGAGQRRFGGSPHDGRNVRRARGSRSPQERSPARRAATDRTRRPRPKITSDPDSDCPTGAAALVRLTSEAPTAVTDTTAKFNMTVNTCKRRTDVGLSNRRSTCAALCGSIEDP